MKSTRGVSPLGLISPLLAQQDELVQIDVNMAFTTKK
jgi:hypothetical protein